MKNNMAKPKMTMEPSVRDILSEMAGVPTLKIYSDGACRGNPGPGGWGAVLVLTSATEDLYGGEAQTTNNRMEMMAVIKALEALPKPCEIDFYTDSLYVRDGLNTWMKNWKKNGWLTASKQPVKNQDLWQKLDELKEKHTITWHWVRGHSGDPMNERADSLARSAIIAQQIHAP